MACRVFEDIGFFTVDNLPCPLISRFAELLLQTEGAQDRVCMVMDLRGGQFFHGMEDGLRTLDEVGISYEIVFLEASNDVLIQRFKEARRRHPASPDGSILSGIEYERSKLEGIRHLADHVIDTSALSNNQLRQKILRIWNDDLSNMRITITSFGFKHGMPLDLDLSIDVRFLKNPYYIPDLRPLTGRNESVRNYILAQDEAQKFLEMYATLVSYLLPAYMNQGKSYLTIGVGCTGGQHRSVVMAHELGNRLKATGADISVVDRDH